MRVNAFLCNKRLQRKLPDPFTLLRNGVWPRETNGNRWIFSIIDLKAGEGVGFDDVVDLAGADFVGVDLHGRTPLTQG